MRLPSPDSKRLVFVSTRKDGFANLWMLDLATRKSTGAHVGSGRRLPTLMVAGWELDRIFVGAGE